METLIVTLAPAVVTIFCFIGQANADVSCATTYSQELIEEKTVLMRPILIMKLNTHTQK
jgi:hypothetical protein